MTWYKSLVKRSTRRVAAVFVVLAVAFITGTAQSTTVGEQSTTLGGRDAAGSIGTIVSYTLNDKGQVTSFTYVGRDAPGGVTVIVQYPSSDVTHAVISAYQTGLPVVINYKTNADGVNFLVWIAYSPPQWTWTQPMGGWNYAVVHAAGTRYGPDIQSVNY